MSVYWIKRFCPQITEIITTHKCFGNVVAIFFVVFIYTYERDYLAVESNGSFWILNWVFLFAYKWCLNMKFKFNRNALWIFLDQNKKKLHDKTSTHIESSPKRFLNWIWCCHFKLTLDMQIFIWWCYH